MLARLGRDPLEQRRAWSTGVERNELRGVSPAVFLTPRPYRWGAPWRSAPQCRRCHGRERRRQDSACRRTRASARGKPPFGGGQVYPSQDDNFPTFRLLVNPFISAHQCDSRLLPGRNECDDFTYSCALEVPQSSPGCAPRFSTELSFYSRGE